MHMVTDEHGNVIHGHHDHDGHGHTHGHEHTHIHEHDHAHEHPHGEGDAVEETRALVGYMADHNKHHAMELAELAEKLKELGKNEAAELLEKSVAEFDKGNRYLEEALAALSEK